MARAFRRAGYVNFRAGNQYDLGLIAAAFRPGPVPPGEGCLKRPRREACRDVAPYPGPPAPEPDAADRRHGGRGRVHHPPRPGAPAVGAIGVGRPRLSRKSQQPDRGARRAGRGGQGGDLSRQRRRAVDGHRGRGDRAGHPQAVAADDLPADHRGRRHRPGPDPEVAGWPAAPGGGASDRPWQREQLPQRALARLDRLLRRRVPRLPARGPGPLAHRVHHRDRRPDRADRNQPDPARRALRVRRHRRLGDRDHLAWPDRVRLRGDPAGRRAPGDTAGCRGAGA